MSDRPALYLDASAIVKWVVRESEWRALSTHLRDRPVRVTSRIAFVEVHRALARVGGTKSDERISAVFDRIVMLELDAAVAATAARLGPLILRTLDAIHLASAMAIGGQLEAIVTYDRRLADAARTLGIEVASPGAAI